MGLFSDSTSQAIPLLAADEDRPFFDFSLFKQDAGVLWDGAHSEGELAVDVSETATEVFVVAPLAGTPPESISLHLVNDVITIRGERHSPIPKAAMPFYQECFWGTFSRTIVLPVEVRPESARASYQRGVLTVSLEKAQHTATIPLLVIEE